MILGTLSLFIQNFNTVIQHDYGGDFLTHFMSLIAFYAPLKTTENQIYLKFSGV